MQLDNSVLNFVVMFIYRYQYAIIYAPFALILYGFFSKKIKLSPLITFLLIPGVGVTLILFGLLPFLNFLSPGSCCSKEPGACFGVVIFTGLFGVPIALFCSFIALLLISKKLVFASYRKVNLTALGLIIGFLVVTYRIGVFYPGKKMQEQKEPELTSEELITESEKDALRDKMMRESGLEWPISPDIVAFQFQSCDAKIATLNSSQIACWGWWDNGDCAGDDRLTCGGEAGETGCELPASKCKSGKVKAISVKSMRGKSECLIMIWEYACL